MIDPKKKELLEQLKNTNYGQALREYLDGKLDEIGNVINCESWDETLGRKYAVKLIREIFYMMEKKETNPRNKGEYR